MFQPNAEGEGEGTSVEKPERNWVKWRSNCMEEK